MANVLNKRNAAIRELGDDENNGVLIREIMEALVGYQNDSEDKPLNILVHSDHYLNKEQGVAFIDALANEVKKLVKKDNIETPQQFVDKYKVLISNRNANGHPSSILLSDNNDNTIIELAKISTKVIKTSEPYDEPTMYRHETRVISALGNQQEKNFTQHKWNETHNRGFLGGRFFISGGYDLKTKGQLGIIY